jgi:ABC-type phosphate/phosphonate transport system permease subunit
VLTLYAILMSAGLLPGYLLISGFWFVAMLSTVFLALAGSVVGFLICVVLCVLMQGWLLPLGTLVPFGTSEARVG